MTSDKCPKCRRNMELRIREEQTLASTEPMIIFEYVCPKDGTVVNPGVFMTALLKHITGTGGRSAHNSPLREEVKT